MDQTDGVSSPYETGSFVTDGGLETDLIFHHGVDLPDFASFPLSSDERGRGLLTATTTGTPTCP